MTTEEKVKAVEEHIAHTMGTQDHHYNPIFGKRLRYTDGVECVAETCGAYWLIDLIFSHQLKPRVRAEPFQVWQLNKGMVKPDEVRVTCWSDTPNKSTNISRQVIPYTDFPDELMPFDMWLSNGVLYLPAEH